MVCGSLVLAGFLASSSAQAWQLQFAPLVSDWAQLVDTNNPLPEYPRPQMVRTNWLNLNGIWQFQAGTTNDPVPTNQTLSGTILVPYPMESALSGVAEYHARSWYRRTFTVPAGWGAQHILLHLDAVDWESEVFINGQTLGIHRGGYDSATYDITPYLIGSGSQELIVRDYDPTDNAGEPRGKQTLYPGGIMYTSCSGIWQPVWLEPVPATSIAGLKLVPDIDNNRLNVTVTVAGPTNGVSVNAIARIGTNLVGSVSGPPGAGLFLPIPNPNLWSPTNPFLYDLTVTIFNGPTNLDSVTSYFGMRKISLGTSGGFVKMLLNNSFVFQFGTLDQGFWPDGIYTAPTDDALKSDIEQQKAFGFNMVRKHIKVERARWYYWADKLGLVVWQDMPSLNSYTGNPQPIDAPQFETELVRLVQNHWNHPSIIMWVIFNEAQGQHDTAALVQEVKTLDPSRLVNQASGNDYFGVGDVIDSHSYPNPSYQTSTNQAAVNGEFGGVGLSITNHIWASGGGYIPATNGDDLASQFEFFCFQLSDFVQNHGLSAAVYTQITDVETELNGLLTYDRRVRKPDVRRIQAAILSASMPLVLTNVVPTSQITAQTWRYTNNTPATNWFATNYTDTAWSSGPGGFGAGNPPNTAGILRTAWTNSDIWLRRTFNPGNLTSQQITNLAFSVFHDEDVEIYINGVLAGSAAGYSVDYGLLPMLAAGQTAIRTNATNVLAVHCHQTGGGQYIDVGIVVRNSPVLALPAIPGIPTGLIAAPGTLGVSLGWNTTTGATSYNIKRSSSIGGPFTNIVTTSPANSATDATVAYNTTYYYVVSAANVSGDSANSSVIAVTSSAAPIPVPPVLRTWFKADAISGLTNGAPVTTWLDATTNGFNATQGTANLSPTFVTGAINGRPVVRFNSTNQTYLAFSRPVKGDFTILCVYRSSQGIGTGTQFYQGAGLVNGEVGGVTDDFGVSLNASGRLLAGTGRPDVTVASTGTSFNNGLPHIMTFKRTQSTGELKLYADGVLQGTATGGLQSLTAPSQLVLGAQQTLNNYLNGDIAEVKIYNSALSDADRSADENALSCKYGLGLGALPSAPGSLAASAGNRQVFLNWQPVIGAGTYKVTWSTNAGGPFLIRASALAANAFSDTNAVSGMTNFYKVATITDCGSSTNSAPVAVFLPLPTLSVNVSPGSLNLLWPGWASDWMLLSATNLVPPIVWSHVTNMIASTNGQFIVSLPSNSGVEFFRLTSP
ncbi:MAG: glycoside hydrolase family 2 [Pedosphaera sp.]|nr:glycoside hydrolase family 2 [Pedosphaera sp.]